MDVHEVNKGLPLSDALKYTPKVLTCKKMFKES
jgi:hypothetical protein